MFACLLKQFLNCTLFPLNLDLSFTPFSINLSKAKRKKSKLNGELTHPKANYLDTNRKKKKYVEIFRGIRDLIFFLSFCFFLKCFGISCFIFLSLCSKCIDQNQCNSAQSSKTSQVFAHLPRTQATEHPSSTVESTRCQLFLYYGNVNCQVSKEKIIYQMNFWPKINKLYGNYGIWSIDVVPHCNALSKSAKILLSKSIF